jgi:hypothetical protein
MSVIKIENFGGISPRTSARLQKPNEATRADNCKLLSGELRGLHETQVLVDLNPSFPSSVVQRAFRLPLNVGAPLPIGVSDTWLGFKDANVDFVRTPVQADSFERYYWTGDSFNLGGAPQYNTRARINAGNTGGNAPFILGLPSPANAVTFGTIPSGTDSVRVYVYTFITAYGEESAPSPPSAATSGTAGTWNVVLPDTLAVGALSNAPYVGNINVTTKRLYRTITGLTSTEFYKVADIAIGTTTYADAATDTTVVANTILPSTTWTPPPATLKGIVAHPGGFLVGFSGRDLYMSEPFRPHAWPVQYIQTMQTEIVGVAIYNDTIVVTTTSHPYTGQGLNPLTITMQKIDSVDPCLSRRSMVTTIDGVYYSSPQGVIRATSGRTELVTQSLFTREEWQTFFSPTTVYAAPYGLQYIAFYTQAAGFIYSPSEELAPLTTLDRFSGVVAIQQDQYSGDVYLIQNNQVRLWDPTASSPLTYTWVSKEFDMPKPINMGAFRLKFKGNAQQISASQLADYTTFNNGRIAKPLNCINLAMINGVRAETVAGYYQLQIKNPIGGSPLFNIAAYLNVNSAVQVTILARDLAQSWNTIYSFSVSSENIYRLPTGLKADGWQIQFVGNVPIYDFVMAETAKELVAG